MSVSGTGREGTIGVGVGIGIGIESVDRAADELMEFDVADFFEAVGLAAPQITLEIITDS